MRITGSAADDTTARAACLELAHVLEVTVDPDPDVLHAVLRLLRDPDSPLQGRSAERLTATATDLARRLA